VRCEHEILKNYQPEVSLESLRKLSEDNKWLQNGGTPLYNIGRILENYKLSIVRRYDCDLDTVSRELHGGCQVIVAVNAEKLYGQKDEGQVPNHAVVVRSIDKNTITLFDPQYQREDNYETDQFLAAWKDSQFYMVSAAERSLRKYDPQPIDVTNFQLSNDIEDLIEAIAENSHDIWARQRMDEGWTYGEKRDDDLKLHPDLVPYSDLTKEEKKYDRITAIGILKLIQRLGYEIKKK
jgi:ABC-type bacteriocin/lantibiotic exporter with double-glycine peptidase domain